MAKPSITKRITKSAALTYSELDTNFQNLADATLTLRAGTGGTNVTADLNGTITLVAGTNVTLTGDNSAKTITIDATGGSSNSFGTVSVAGQSDVVADSVNDTLTLSAGTGITLTTNSGTDTITITSSGGASGATLYSTTYDANWSSDTQNFTIDNLKFGISTTGQAYIRAVSSTATVDITYILFPPPSGTPSPSYVTNQSITTSANTVLVGLNSYGTGAVYQSHINDRAGHIYRVNWYKTANYGFLHAEKIY
jgi:hypothetical protein